MFNIGRGDTVSVILANTPAMLECHYGVPMCGGVLHSINTRLDAAVVAFQLDHAQAQVLIVDREFMAVAQDALALATVKPVLIQYDDPEFAAETPTVEALDYEAVLSAGDPAYDWLMPRDEWDAISINYTSGTTGDPKGCRLSSSRGLFAGAGECSDHLHGQARRLSLDSAHVPLQRLVLPLGRSVPLLARMFVCGRSGLSRFGTLADEDVTHLCGAPIVMSLLISAPDAVKRDLSRTVQFFTAAAPPPEPVLAGMKEAGFDVTHLYGLTETYGPAVVNDWQAAVVGLTSLRAGSDEVAAGGSIFAA